MKLTDQRLGEVLARSDHVRQLPEVNPVLWLFIGELARTWPRYSDEVRDAGAFLADLIRANEPGVARVGVPTATRVLAEIETDRGRSAYTYLAAITHDDLLLRLSVDALLAYSDRSRRRRSKPERDAVAVTLYVLLKMVREETEVEQLERALAV